LISQSLAAVFGDFIVVRLRLGQPEPSGISSIPVSPTQKILLTTVPCNCESNLPRNVLSRVAHTSEIRKQPPVEEKGS